MRACLLVVATVLAMPAWAVAASPPDAEALTEARAYASGSGVARDVARAAEMFRALAEGGNAEAARLLGDLVWRGAPGLARDDAEAVRWYRQAAEAGDAAASTAMAIAYQTGRGDVEPDRETANAWFRSGVGDAKPVYLPGERPFRAYPVGAFGNGNRFEILSRPVGALEIASPAGTYRCNAFLVGDALAMASKLCFDAAEKRLRKAAAPAVYEITAELALAADDGAYDRYAVDTVPVQQSAETDFVILRASGSPGSVHGIVPVAVPAESERHPVLNIVTLADDWLATLPLSCDGAFAPQRDGGKPCDVPWGVGAVVFDLQTDTAVGIIGAGEKGLVPISFADIARQSDVIAGLAEAGER